MTTEQLRIRSSNLERSEYCPASYWDQDAPPEKPSADAERGTMLHAYVLEGKPAKLSPPDEEIADKAREALDVLVESAEEITYTEHAFEFEVDGATITGHPDHIRIRAGGKRALIADLKFGRDPVTDAAINLQLLAYAIMVAKRHPEVQEFELVVIQPMVRGGGTRCVVTREELRHAYRRITNIVDAIRDARTNREFRPSEKACKHCRRLPICSPHRQQIQVFAQLDTSPQRWELATVEEKLELWRWIKTAKKAIATIEWLFRCDLERDANAFHGKITIKKTKGRPKIEDCGGFYEALKAAVGLTGEEFARACTVRMTDLKPLVKRHQDLKGKKFDAWFDSVFDKFGTRGKESFKLESNL